MKLTRDKAIEEFRKMWNWIADETERCGEKMWPEDYLHEFGFDWVQDDFLCEYKRQNKTCACCGNCPISFNEDGGPAKDCEDAGSPYDAWYWEEDWKKAAELARRIANLPEREEAL